MVYDGVTKLNEKQNKFVDSVLDYYLGIVPTLFKYNGKTITPKIYLEEILEINPDDYVEITSYTHHPFYTKFILEDKYNWTGDAYYNVTMDDFSTITDNAFKHEWMEIEDQFNYRIGGCRINY
jgi:bleomycin hydrolase